MENEASSVLLNHNPKSVEFLGLVISASERKVPVSMFYFGLQLTADMNWQ